MTNSSSLSKAAMLGALGTVVLLGNAALGATIPAYGAVGAALGGAVGLLTMAGSAVFLSRAVRLLRDVGDVIVGGASGDLDVRIFAIPESGLVGRLQMGANDLLDVVDAFTREAAGSAQYLSQRKYFRKVLPKGLPGVFNITAQTMNRAATTMAANVDDFSRFAETNVGGVVDGITSAATELRSAAEAMTTMAQDLTALTAQIGARVASSSALAQRVAGEVERTNATVGNLTTAAHTVDGVVNIISEISRKTEMLAINATIEAAKAGQLGNGFAVVASEIKALALQTEAATREIAGEIGRMRRVVGQVETAIGGIHVSVLEMNEGSRAIAAAIADESACATAPSIVNAVAGTSVASTQVLGAASDLMDEAGRLNDEIAVFMDKVRGTEVRPV